MDLKISFITVNYPNSIVALRWVASVIDLIFLGSLSGIFMVLNPDSNVHISLILLIVALYYIVLEGLTGYTLGKVITRIKVVNNEGYAPGLIKSLIRSALRLIEVNPFFFGGIIAGIVCLSTARRQRIGDLAAGTFVITVRDLKDFFEKKEKHILDNESSFIDSANNSLSFNADSNTFFKIDSVNVSGIGKLKNEINKSKKTTIIISGVFSLLVVLSIFISVINSNNYNFSDTGREKFKGKKIAGKNKAIEVVVPYSWFKESDDEYELFAGDSNDNYVAVVRIDKEEYADDYSLLEYCEAKNYDLGNNMKNGEGTEFENIIISGHPAIQFEYSGEEDSYKIGYMFTVVEVPDAFYQISGWTTQNRFASSRETFHNIANSFRVRVGSKEEFNQKYPNQKGNYR